jgi:hypothetical protein
MLLKKGGKGGTAEWIKRINGSRDQKVEKAEKVEKVEPPAPCSYVVADFHRRPKPLAEALGAGAWLRTVEERQNG